MRDELSDLRVKYSGLIIDSLKETRRVYWYTLLQTLVLNVISIGFSVLTGGYMGAVLIFLLSVYLEYKNRKSYYTQTESLYSSFKGSYTIDDMSELLVNISDLEEYLAGR